MKRTLLLSLLALAPMLAQSAQPQAQPQPQPPAPIISPEVHGDHTVTFRLRDPNAKEVFLSREGREADRHAERRSGRVERHTDPLEPDILWLHFHGRRRRLVRPYQSPSMKPNFLFNTQSEVHVPGPASLPWEVNDVPRGEVHHHFYHSAVVGDDRDFYVYTPPGYDAKAKKPVSGFVPPARLQR